MENLNVAVAECPPFVMKEDGAFTGLAITLWEKVAEQMGLTWQYFEFELGTMLEGFGSGHTDRSIDVGISCISITAEREKLIDFSHSFTETHTAIAVRDTGIGESVMNFFTNPVVLKGFVAILAIAAVIGLIFFALEYNKNKKLFSTETAWGRGIETMIIGLLFVTNGPLRYYRFKTLTARVLATVLALSSTVLIASVTAVLATSFTINSLQSPVTNLNDLRDLRVGALEASTSSAFLHANHIAHQTRLDLDTLITDLDAGVLDAIISDAAFLQYRIRQGQARGRLKSLTVLPMELEEQNYAFVLDVDDPDGTFREGINQALLSVRQEREWHDLVVRYLGTR